MKELLLVLVLLLLPELLLIKRRRHGRGEMNRSERGRPSSADPGGEGETVKSRRGRGLVRTIDERARGEVTS